MLKEERGQKLPSDAIPTDLMEMAYGVVLSGQRAVIAHVVLPREFSEYERFMSDRRVPMLSVVLQPSVAVVLERNALRKCWPEPTPEYWVRHFRDEFDAWHDPGKTIVYDSSNEQPETTARTLAAMAQTHSVPPQAE
jgi:hypothetical protein